MAAKAGQHEQWRACAQRKAHDTLSRIPDGWRLDDSVISKARSLVNIADTFIASLLDPAERAITALTGVEIVEKVSERNLTAEAVTHTFCKRVAFAHQLVYVP